MNSDLRCWTLPRQTIGHNYTASVIMLLQYIPDIKFLEFHPVDISPLWISATYFFVANLTYSLE